MAHNVIPLAEWTTPDRAIAKDIDVNKNVISISDTDYEWLKEQSKELGRDLFKDESGPKKKIGSTKRTVEGRIQKGGNTGWPVNPPPEKLRPDEPPPGSKDEEEK